MAAHPLVPKATPTFFFFVIPHLPTQRFSFVGKRGGGKKRGVGGLGTLFQRALGRDGWQLVESTVTTLSTALSSDGIHAS